MRREFRTTAAIALTFAGLSLAGCGGGGTKQDQGTANGEIGAPSSAAAPATSAPAAGTTAQRHHSKLAGAAVGAVVGHELGGHAAAGAAAGALIQHHRNKKARD